MPMMAKYLIMEEMKMQINNNLFARQTPLMMGNKIGGAKPNSVVAKAISNVQNMLPTQDTLDQEHIKKIFELEKSNSLQPEVEDKTETNNTTNNVDGLNSKSPEEVVQNRIEKEIDNVVGKSNTIDKVMNYLDIAQAYEDMANQEGASQELIDFCNDIVSDIKKYVAQEVTTGNAIKERMDNLEKDSYDGLMDIYNSQDETHSMYETVKNWGAGNAMADEIIQSLELENSLKDVGLDNLKSNYDDMSIDEMREVLSSAQDKYDTSADTLMKYYENQYGKDLSKQYNDDNHFVMTENNIDTIVDELSKGMNNMFMSAGEITLLETENGIEINSTAEYVPDWKVEINTIQTIKDMVLNV